MPIENVAQAIYCANPDAFSTCKKICSDVGVSGIGLRTGTYVQAIAFFALTLLSPYEDGAESVWVGLSVSYAMLVTCFIQLYQGFISSHHATVIFLLSMLPYLGTLAAMNSLTAYRGLNALGMRVLQFALLFKTLLSAVLWYLILYSFFAGQLASWSHLSFRQPECFESTALVVFFVAVRPSDKNKTVAHGLLIFYTIVWAILLIFGTYWTFRAPIFLANQRKMAESEPLDGHGAVDARGYPLVNGPNAPSTASERKQVLKRDPNAFHADDSDQADYLLFHSLPKGGGNELDLSAQDTASPALESTESTESTVFSEPNVEPWTVQEVQKTHQYFIWPVVAIFLTLNIVTTELQIDLNDIYEGEMEWDFPGTLSTLLAIPTVWAVAKSIRRIQTGKRPSILERQQENFFRLGRLAGRSEARRQALKKQKGKPRTMASFSSNESQKGCSSEEEEMYDSRGRRRR